MVYIVTITYNDLTSLRRTVESVRANRRDYHRFAVIDGGSADGTVEFLRENRDVVDWFVSERDHGIYDAMNKASHIPGIMADDFLIWINGGDELLPWQDDVEKVLSGYDCAFFNVLLGAEGHTEARLAKVDIKLPYDAKNFSPASTFWHQGFLIRFGLFSKCPYDCSVGIQAENLLMSRAILSSKYFVSQVPVAKFYIGGVSSRVRSFFPSWLKVAKRLGFSKWDLLLGQRFFVLRQLVKMLLPEDFVYKCFVRNRLRWIKEMRR